MKPPFLSEMFAESMWRAMGWTCDSKRTAVLTTLKKRLCTEKYGVVAKYKSRET